MKSELLADLATQPAETMISFDDSNELGAMNLRGTGFAARDVEVRQLRVVTPAQFTTTTNGEPATGCDGGGAGALGGVHGGLG